MDRRWLVGIAVCALFCTVLSAAVLAAEQAATGPAQGQTQQQDTPRGDRGDRGQRGDGPRGFDSQAMQQRMMERMKEQLQASDDDWKVIEPRLSKVMTLSRQTLMGRFGGMGRRGFGPGGDRPQRQDADQSDNPVQKAQTNLEQTLTNENAPAADIKANLTALREAREKTRQEMAKAQDDLRQVLTLRQEAQLVMTGMLD
ncbi:MAG: hypothetical protein LLF76_01085 [Planctomycetaceae bacterium]|nr:hypothetical protein [Planctomycetaceae bacterium]